MILSKTYNIVHQQPNTFNKAKLGVTRGSYANRVCNGNVTLPKKKIACGAASPGVLGYASKVRAVGFIPPAVGFSQQYMHWPELRDSADQGYAPIPCDPRSTDISDELSLPTAEVRRASSKFTVFPVQDRNQSTGYRQTPYDFTVKIGSFNF